jgi:hypothetical protein
MGFGRADRKAKALNEKVAKEGASTQRIWGWCFVLGVDSGFDGVQNVLLVLVCVNPAGVRKRLQ